VPVEAMASGRPVIAYDKGGVRDTVRDGTSGILYPDQSVEGLLAAISRFEGMESRFSADAIMAEAARFSADRFRAEMSGLIAEKLANFRKNGPFLD
jgi:glycosyltransferase involved in cell wall biosynthesis